jgi:hypothetical protein
LAETQFDFEMREVPRFSCTVRPQVRVAVRPNFLPTTVHVKDISTKGIGLLVDSHLAPGACVAVPWMYGSPERWRTLRAHVVRLAPRHDGGWVAGCVFDEWLDDHEVEDFVKYGHRPLPRVLDDQ